MKSEDAGGIQWVGEKREFVAEVELKRRVDAAIKSRLDYKAEIPKMK